VLSEMSARREISFIRESARSVPSWWPKFQNRLTSMLELLRHDKSQKSVRILKVMLVPFGDVDRRNLEVLADKLQQVLPDSEVKLTAAAEIPLNSFVPSRQQSLADAFLSALLKIAQAKERRKALGVTDRDLFAPSMNFVFGQALRNVAVISTYRLMPRHDLNNRIELLQLRILKEAIHELGHTLALGHCPNSFCVMHFSKSIDDTDLKSQCFCSTCSAKVRKLTGTHHSIR